MTHLPESHERQLHVNDIEILDSDRTDDNCPGRSVLNEHGSTEPYVDEMDRPVSMPVRLIHCAGSGLCIELGPYTFSRRDIERLRSAIREYDQAHEQDGRRR